MVEPDHCQEENAAARLNSKLVQEQEIMIQIPEEQICERVGSRTYCPNIKASSLSEAPGTFIQSTACWSSMYTPYFIWYVGVGPCQGSVRWLLLYGIWVRELRPFLGLIHGPCFFDIILIGPRVPTVSAHSRKLLRLSSLMEKSFINLH